LELSAARGIVWDFGNVLIQWDPRPAIVAGVGEAEADRFLAAEDFDFMAWNHLRDAGATWDDGEAEVRRTHPHWGEHAAAYRANFEHALIGPVPGTAELLTELHAAGVPQLGLTNWSHELYPHAPRIFDFLGLLDGVVVSGTEKAAKPDHAIFEIAVSRTGFEAADLVFVDDKAHNVDAAVEFGLDGILFTDAEELRQKMRERDLPV
jgi:2-haloacid dehalogenase